MKIKYCVLIIICLLFSSGLAQDFSVDMLFTPGHDPNQAKTRTFAGEAASSDGYDANDVMGAPPGQIYYVYFRIDEFPRYLWTDSKHWETPFGTDKIWKIFIENATGILTTITWNPNDLPVLPGKHFYLHGTDFGVIDMQQANTALATGNKQLEIHVGMPTGLFELTIAVNPENGGVTTPAAGTYLYDVETVVSLSTDASPGFNFSNWTGPVANPNIQETFVTMDWDKTVTANFEYQEFSINTSTIGNGNIILKPDKTSYYFNDVVEISALPDTGWSFNEWFGDLTGRINPDTITITGNMDIAARFIQNEYTLTINNIGDGVVTKIPDKLFYFYNDTVQISAHADVGWSFDSWSGDLTGKNNPENITIKGNTLINAHFLQNEYVISINFVGNGTVEKNPDLPTYYLNDEVQLLAKPDSGWRFDKWTGDVTGNMNPTSITITDNISVTSYFTQEPVPTYPDIEISETALQFGEVEIDESYSLTFLIKNVGTAILEVSGIVISGINKEEFIITNGDAPISLNPDSFQEVEITFLPTTSGQKSATLQISNNDPDEGLVSVTLNGTGKKGIESTNRSYVYPNPFNPERELIYIVYSQSLENVTIKIMDSAGDMVRELNDQHAEIKSKQKKISWDGRNSRGDVVANGIYFYSIKGNKDDRFIGKIAVMREIKRD